MAVPLVEASLTPTDVTPSKSHTINPAAVLGESTPPASDSLSNQDTAISAVSISSYLNRDIISHILLLSTAQHVHGETCLVANGMRWLTQIASGNPMQRNTNSSISKYQLQQHKSNKLNASIVYGIIVMDRQ